MHPDGLPRWLSKFLWFSAKHVLWKTEMIKLTILRHSFRHPEAIYDYVFFGCVCLWLRIGFTKLHITIYERYDRCRVSLPLRESPDTPPSPRLGLVTHPVGFGVFHACFLIHAFLFSFPCSYFSVLQIPHVKTPRHLQNEVTELRVDKVIAAGMFCLDGSPSARIDGCDHNI